MSTAYRITEKEGAYFLTFQIVGWVDIFTRRCYRDVAVESLQYCQQHKGLLLYAYVIMSNHIHLLVQSAVGDLGGCIRDFKHYTARRFMEQIGGGLESRKEWMKMVFEFHGKLKAKQAYQIWTHENHAELIYSEKFIAQKINYIHENPIRSGIVAKAEDYLYSSARNYAELENVLDVTKLMLKWKTY